MSVDILAALKILVLVYIEDQGLAIAGERPTWFKQLYPQTGSMLTLTWITEHLPVLDIFLLDAAQAWSAGETGLYKSGNLV
ncbi:MAG: bifunctional diguanylate cyclase/phosphodiesterase, partial [Acaryochloridaceae cyanobacterium CSU_5_19]|nr:bifunctional diguanylate cyclase/phosphodiesterase [Acaryochloridaceae cyanobacterium CSU_5_19]